ncbi:MAG TPA: thioredoxin domain-containing protein [Firmicutes bacterium]|nr:thioredoxin domain-containing protein [Bacillota bacterium]
MTWLHLRTCHWCHVTERESFEDAAVAAALNNAFVCIKVDREERPDIDTVYMNVCQALTGSGGWPLTIIMTPDKQPFYAGTYFPPHSQFGRPGLVELAKAITQAWHDNRPDLLKRADQIAQRLQAATAPVMCETALDKSTLDKAYEYFKRAFDPTYGGFGRAPKFPSPHNLCFLLRYWLRTGEADALQMVVTTLEQMQRGGVYDQIGGGFHRYSTDREWLVPHFEKMLYDQAMLAIAYTEAWQATQRADFAQTAKAILDYVLRDMQAPAGGFYSAEDADSEGEEGKFYVWTLAEVRQALTPEETQLAIKVFDISEAGNYLEEATGERKGTNILHLPGPLAELAQEYGLSEGELHKQLQQIRQKLFAAREPRVHPFKDTKILTDWNGLMLAALALAGRALGEERFLQAATDCIRFVREQLTTKAGKLYKRWREGEAALPAQLDDYAFLIWGLIELHSATQDPQYLAWALELQGILVQHYWDEGQGGFFLTANDAEELLMRPKEIYDGAIPSGNSVAMLNSLRLARLTGQSKLEEYAMGIWRAFASQIAQQPAAYSFALSALDFALGPAQE